MKINLNNKMCIIGAIKTKHGFQIFKQLDLKIKTKIFSPEIRSGKAGKYLAFSRENITGIWAGMNEHGLTFTAADADCKKDFPFSNQDKKKLFNFYEKIVADFSNLQDAEKFICEKFKNDFHIADILAIGNKEKFILFKFHPPQICERHEISNHALFCTNHFQETKNLSLNLTSEKNSSTFLRLKTVQKLFAKNKKIEEILQNHENGPSEKSICRHGKNGQFFTQACVIFKIEEKLTAKFILNSTTCQGKFEKILLK